MSRPAARRLLRATWRGVLLTMAVAVCAAALVAGAAVLGGYRPVAILTGSMGETAPPGSMAIARPVDEVALGDVLVMRTDGGPTITHRVVDVTVDREGRNAVVTRGDANPDVDPTPYVVGDEELVVRWVVPGAGRMLTAFRRPLLGLALIGFVVGTMAIAALRRIWRPSVPTPPTASAETARAGGGDALGRTAIAAATIVGVIAAGGGTAWSVYTGVHGVGGNTFTARACYDARLGSVQTGQLTSSADGTAAAALATVDPARSFVLASVSSSSADPQDSTVLTRLASATSLEVVRQTSTATPPDVVVEWSVVEYDCGVSVQRGEVVGAGSAQVDVAIAAVDTTTSFVLVDGVAAQGDTDLDGADLATAELLNATTVRIRTGAAMAAGSRIGWQVVSFDGSDDAAVQHLTGALADGTAQSNVVLPVSVDPNSSIVVATVRAAGGGPDVGARTVRARLVDADTVELSRSITTGAVDVAVQVVEVLDGTTVQRGVIDLAAGDASATASIAPFQVTRSTITSTVWQPGSASGGSTAMATDDVAGEASARMRFVDAQTVELARDATSADASFAWQAVMWGGPGWADLQAPFRRRIDVTAGSVVTPQGYTTPVVLDHASMVTDGLSLADGSDLRVWRHDGTSWTELDRVLDDASSWDAADTTFWFRTQESIAAGSTVSYWLYFGDATPAAPLEDPANVWLVTEDFDDGTLGSFVDRTGGTGWYRAAAWTHRIVVTIDPSAVAADLTDEVVHVHLTDADLAANAQSDASDVRFTAADGTTVLPHDVEDYDAATGTLDAWVRVPTVSSASPTVLHLYFGAADAPAQLDARSTWADEFAVWQLAADPTGAAPALDDAGPNRLDGIALADAARIDTATGPAVDLDGALDRMESSPVLAPDGALSVAAWFRPDTTGADAVLAANGDPTTSGGFELAVDASGALRARIRLDGVPIEVIGGSVSAGSWAHAAATWDGTTLRLYVDGTEVGSVAASGSPSSTVPVPVVIGAAPSGADALDGAIGQVRLDDSAWNAAQVAFRSASFAGPGSVVAPAAATTGTWFDQGDWTERRPLTVDANMVAGTLTDYPLLVHLTDADLAASTQTDADDLVFTAADGVTRLDHDIESWNPATGELVAWVRVPSLDGTADTTLYLYTSNATAVDQRDPVGVWGPDADLVLTGAG